MFHARDGAIFSKNSTFVFFDGASPITENGIQLRSPSPIMAPGRPLYFAMFVPIQSGGQLCESAYCSHVGVCVLFYFLPLAVYAHEEVRQFSDRT